MQEYLSKAFAGGSARLVVPRGATDSSENIRAVILADGENVNRELIDQGYGEYREDLGGAEARAMKGAIGRATGSLAEGLAFQGDSGILNPMHYLPSPGHTKFWQERTPLAQYLNNEVVGTRMRRWQRPVHDFLMPYLRGKAERMLGETRCLHPAGPKNTTGARAREKLKLPSQAPHPTPSPGCLCDPAAGSNGRCFLPDTLHSQSDDRP